MAFATTNTAVSVAGDMYVFRGDCTAGTADANGTIKVPGAKVYGCFVTTHDSSGAFSTQPCRYSVSGSFPVTVTIYNQGPITAGEFLIFSK